MGHITPHISCPLVFKYKCPLWEQPFAQMPTAPRFLQMICRAYLIGIQRATLKTSGCFNDALNNTHKDLKDPHESTQQQGFLWKTIHQLQFKPPYKFFLVTTATQHRCSHRVVQDTIQVVEPIKQGEERRAQAQIQNRIQVEINQPLL